MKISKKVLVSALKTLVNGESWISVLFYIILVYLVFSYVLLPAIYSFTSISYISAVVSGSMDHSFPGIQYTYNYWLQRHGLNDSSWPYSGGISVGSLIIVYKTAPSQIKVGDVIVYTASYQGVTEEVVHRVINETDINGTYYYTTKGDANNISAPFEINLPYSDVTGKLGTVIPYLGYPKYILYLISTYI